MRNQARPCARPPLLYAGKPEVVGQTRLRRIDVRNGPSMTVDQRSRLVSLLANGIERYLRAIGARGEPLTSSSELCLYTDHGDDDEAVNG